VPVTPSRVTALEETPGTQTRTIPAFFLWKQLHKPQTRQGLWALPSFSMSCKPECSMLHCG